jgi:hypothetical protein
MQVKDIKVGCVYRSVGRSGHTRVDRFVTAISGVIVKYKNLDKDGNLRNTTQKFSLVHFAEKSSHEVGMIQ